MANVDNGNTIYLDSTGAISNTRGLVIKHVIITPTAASASLILRDQATGTPTKLRIDIAAAGNPLHIPRRRRNAISDRNRRRNHY